MVLKAVAIKKTGKKKLPYEQARINASLVLRKGIVSESLAKLLAKQGHHTKAMIMYRKLSLIFPKKSSFFASQIEKLRKK